MNNLVFNLFYEVRWRGNQTFSKRVDEWEEIEMGGQPYLVLSGQKDEN